MKSISKYLFLSLLLLAFNASAVVVVNNSVAGSTTNDFNALSTGSVAGFISQSGATYGEKFAGQTLSTAGGFDSLSGLPSTPLALEANAAVADNIGILFHSGSNTIYGDLGGAVGEGALSILFDVETSIFGFDIVGVDGGDFTVDLFGTNGSLLGSFTQAAANSFFGFEVASGDLIAGVSITNTDPAGIAYDNITFNANVAAVPEPSTYILFLLGLMGVFAIRRRSIKS